MYRAGLVLGPVVFIVGILEWLLLLSHYIEFLGKIAPWLGPVYSPSGIWVTIGTGIVIFVIAWIKRKEELSGTPEHKSVPPSGGITQTANPSFSQSGATQKVEIHNYPASPPPASTEPTGKEVKQDDPPTHNVVFKGARRTKLDFELTREIDEDQQGLIAVKACFLNQSIPGKSVSDFDYAKARIVYTTAAGREIAEISQVAWIGPNPAKHVHIEVNHPECLVLAVWGYPDKVWHAPYVTWRKSEYWEDGDQTELDGRPLPLVEHLAAEITVVGGKGIGLKPVFVYMSLGPKGDVKFL